jgi:hypothetical protein
VVIAAPPLIGAARSAKPLVDAVPQLASSAASCSWTGTCRA